MPDGTVLPGKTYMAYKDTWLYHFRQFWHYFADKPLHPSLNWQQYMAKHRQYSLKGDEELRWRGCRLVNANDTRGLTE